VRASLAADMRYRGQAMEIEVRIADLPAAGSGSEWLDGVRTAYEAQYTALYRRAFGHLEVEVMNWRLAVVDTRPTDLWAGAPGSEAVPRTERPAYFPELGGFAATSVWHRHSLASGWSQEGPAIIEERESTIIVPPGATATVDELGNVVVAL
jgi:N-methylhydantoinase A